MNSWHFVDGYLVLVGEADRRTLKASTVEDGLMVSCTIKDDDIQPTFDKPGSARSQAACTDAVWQRKSQTGFKSAADVMERVVSRWGRSTHDLDGHSFVIEREANGDLLASANHHFDTLSMRLSVSDGLFQEAGTKVTGGFDTEAEKLYQAMRKLLAKRRDWDMAAKLV